MIELLSVLLAVLALAVAVWAVTQTRRLQGTAPRHPPHSGSTGRADGRAENSAPHTTAAPRRQVEDVTAWMSSELHDAGGSTPVIEVQNRSSAPIYDLVVVVSTGLFAPGAHPMAGRDSRLRMQIFPPGHLVYGLHQERIWDTGRRPDECRRLRPMTTSTDQKVTAFEFTDASGTRWRRDENGVLEEVSPESQ